MQLSYWAGDDSLLASSRADKDRAGRCRSPYKCPLYRIEITKENTTRIIPTINTV